MDRSTPPVRYDDHQIAAGIRGWLESPAIGATIDDRVFVVGWAFSSGPPIVEVWADLGGRRVVIPCGLRRDDVAAAYPNEAHSARSGFSAPIAFDTPPDNDVRVEIRARLADGRSVHLFTRRLATVRDGTGSNGLLSREWWRQAWSRLVGKRRRRAAPPISVVEALEHASRAALVSFLATGSRLALPSPADPLVSVVVVVWNRADLTLSCLRALAAERAVDFEVVLVDNASSDETAELLTRVDGLTVLRNAVNEGFTAAANAGARAARGAFLLFLNNDADILPGTIARLLESANRDRSVGVVGGKLVFPDGRLQEAGSIVWSDGSCEAYGRGGDPTAPEFNFERRVDFCSAALMLTPRALFNELGGFDERYRPAYYEDADYCVRVWSRGCSVVYQPGATAIHREFGSAVSRDASIELQRERRALFSSLHAEWLSTQRSRENERGAPRWHPHQQRSAIVVDDAAPDGRMGAGFPRAAALVRGLEELGYVVTVYETAPRGDRLARTDHLRSVEIVPGGPEGLRGFLISRLRRDLVIVSRPHNMQFVKAALNSDLSALGVPCIYDAEAVFAVRAIGRAEIAGKPMTDRERHAAVDAELALARGCAAVLVVNEAERKMFAGAGGAPAFVLGHAVDSRPTPAPYECRRAMLFVGAFSPDSPNDDAIRFFCGDVLPRLRAAGCRAPLVVAGARIPEQLKASADSAVQWCSDIDDLTPLYDDARVFVAPTRFGAGIPLKIVEAAARGVPIVCTSLAARQLGWDQGTELLIADSPAEFVTAVTSLFSDRGMWAALRDNALARVGRDHNPEAFRSALQRALTRS